MHAAQLVDGHELRGEFLSLDRLLQAPVQEIVIHLLGRRQARAVDRIEGRQLLVGEPAAERDRLRRGVAQPIVELRVADVGGVLRGPEKPGPPMEIEKPLQSLALAPLSFGRWKLIDLPRRCEKVRRHGREDGRRDRGRQQENRDRQQDGPVHATSLPSPSPPPPRP